MPRYRIRFLKPDDSYAKAELNEDFADDAAVSDYVREHYGRKALEVWCGERRVTRRVSGAHEARARGHYPQSCRYAALSTWSLDSFERRHGRVPFPEFEALGRASDAVFGAYCQNMTRHRTWIWALAHPRAPPTVPAIRISFHPTRRDPGAWVGWTTATIFGLARDGEALVEDLADATAAALVAAHAATPGFDAGALALRRKAILTRSGATTAPIDCDWSFRWGD